jgi:hypothetical protein
VQGEAATESMVGDLATGARRPPARTAPVPVTAKKTA